MSGQTPTAANAANTFEDLTGISTSSFSNPYDALITACEDDPVFLSLCLVNAHADEVL